MLNLDEDKYYRRHECEHDRDECLVLREEG